MHAKKLEYKETLVVFSQPLGGPLIELTNVYFFMWITKLQEPYLIKERVRTKQS